MKEITRLLNLRHGDEFFTPFKMYTQSQVRSIVNRLEKRKILWKNNSGVGDNTYIMTREAYQVWRVEFSDEGTVSAQSGS